MPGQGTGGKPIIHRPPPPGGRGSSPPHGGHGGGGGSQHIRGRNIIQQAIAYARRQLGTPYVWGGSAPGGFDCSGLVYAAYRAAGYTGIGRTTYSQINQGVAVGKGQLQPGDIVFPSAHHEGLYIGNGMVLEAPHTGDHVKIIPLSSFGFMTARRLVGGGGGVQAPGAIGGQSRSGLPIPAGANGQSFSPFQFVTPAQIRAIGAQQHQLAITMAGAQRAFLTKSLKPPKLTASIPQDTQDQGAFGNQYVQGAIDTSGDLLSTIHAQAWRKAGL